MWHRLVATRWYEKPANDQNTGDKPKLWPACAAEMIPVFTVISHTPYLGYFHAICAFPGRRFFRGRGCDSERGPSPHHSPYPENLSLYLHFKRTKAKFHDIKRFCLFVVIALCLGKTCSKWPPKDHLFPVKAAFKENLTWWEKSTLSYSGNYLKALINQFVLIFVINWPSMR